MKQSILALVLFIFSSTIWADEIDVHFVIGQSNAVGGGNVANWDASYGATSDPNVMYAHHSGTGTNQVEGWDIMQPRRTGHTNSVVRRWFGSEITFSHQLDGLQNQAIIKVANDATSLHTDWADGGFMRERYFDYAGDRVQELQQLGHSVNVASVVWIQGEADANNLENSQLYEERLWELRQSIETQFNDSDFLFLYEQKHFELNRPFTDELRFSQDQYLSLDDQAIMIDVDDLNLSGDDVHFTAAMHQELGRRFGIAYRQSIGVPEPGSLLLLASILAFTRRRKFAC